MNYKRNQKYLEKFATREVNARIIERPAQIAYGYLLDWHYESLGNTKLDKFIEDENITSTMVGIRWSVNNYELLDVTRRAYTENLITLAIAEKTFEVLEAVQLPSLYASWNRVKYKSKLKNFFKEKEFKKLLDDVFANSLLGLRKDVQPMKVRRDKRNKIQEKVEEIMRKDSKLISNLRANPGNSIEKCETVINYIQSLSKIRMMAYFAAEEGYLAYDEAIKILEEASKLGELVAKRTRSKNK